jgi:hypothetical protein
MYLSASRLGRAEISAKRLSYASRVFTYLVRSKWFICGKIKFVQSKLASAGIFNGPRLASIILLHAQKTASHVLVEQI